MARRYTRQSDEARQESLRRRHARIAERRELDEKSAQLKDEVLASYLDSMPAI